MEENMVINQVFTDETEETVAQKPGFLAEMKKAAVKIGWKYALFAVAVTILQLLYAILLPEKYHSESWATFLQIIIPMHILGFGLLLLLTCKMPKVKIEKKKLGFGKFVVCVCIGAGICFIGMIVGLVIHLLLTLPFGVNMNDTSALGAIMMSSDAFWRIFTVGICAPIVEELIFRKLLIDRMAKYGEFTAIMMSGLMFGLFHGNFQQAFFATGLGMFWAFIYLRTGKVWHTIAMHMTINLSTSVVTVYIAQWVLKYTEYAMDPNYMNNLMAGDPNAVMATISSYALLGWYGVLIIFAITGIVLFFVNRKKFKLNPIPCGVTKKEAFLKSSVNGGMLLFWIACFSLFAISYGSMIITALMS